MFFWEGLVSLDFCFFENYVAPIFEQVFVPSMFVWSHVVVICKEYMHRWGNCNWKETVRTFVCYIPEVYSHEN